MKASDFSRYTVSQRRVLRAAIARLVETLDRTMPFSASAIRAWLDYHAGSHEPADFFVKGPTSPMFLFPWFLGSTLTARPDAAFQTDVVYSTASGYYYIRLIDNLTDGHATSELQLLPAAGFFHTQFQMPYLAHFAPEHSFWKLFTQVWLHSADVTIHDLQPGEISRQRFLRTAAQKTCAIKIPLAATCYKYGQRERIAEWSRFADLFSCWHQMANDLLHWHEDLSLGTTTYFLSEGRRRKQPDEPLVAWVIREGFPWGAHLLDDWMTRAQTAARALHSPDLQRYLSYRRARSRRECRQSYKALRLASRLGTLVL
jgi:hypothetical protein